MQQYMQILQLNSAVHGCKFILDLQTNKRNFWHLHIHMWTQCLTGLKTKNYITDFAFSKSSCLPEKEIRQCNVKICSCATPLLICFQCRRLQAHIKSETHFIFIMPESLATFIGKVKFKTLVKFPYASHFHPEVVWNRHWFLSCFFLIVTLQVGFCQCVTRSKTWMKPPVLFRWGAPSSSWACQ